MEANTRNLERLFDSTITYQIPLFQRPYVWTREGHWEPLWEDVRELLDRHLRRAKIHPHFLGAVVLEQLRTAAGSVQTRQVIDGQQRFTTLQILLLAARDHAQTRKAGKYAERFGDLASNRESKIDLPHEVFKVWPTNADREPYTLVHRAGSPISLSQALDAHPDSSLSGHNIVKAYRYFHDQIGSWLAAKIDAADELAVPLNRPVEDRLEALWEVVRSQLQLVVIDLERDDESQVIFETLNARGQPLLPADLIKNYLFRRSAAAGDDVEKLYSTHWRGLETDFWRVEVKQGRLKRPRIDNFIQHFLTLMTREDIKASHLFAEFRRFAESTTPPDGSATLFPRTPAEHIALLARYSAVFRTFEEPSGAGTLPTFLRRLEAIDTTTVYPFLLHACAELLPSRRNELDAILTVIESFLVRRLVCGLTPKNYNRLFVDLIRSTERAGGVSASSVAAYLGQARGDSSRFPDDQEFRRALVGLPLYGRLAQYKVRMILEALDGQAQHEKSEQLAMPRDLTIEHVMPQTWQVNWPLPGQLDDDPIARLKAEQRRELLVNTVGNLTLVNDRLNPSMSNDAWEAKRPELVKFGKLNLTRYFHAKEAEVWDEAAIEARSSHLFTDALKLWPGIDLQTSATSNESGSEAEAPSPTVGESSKIVVLAAENPRRKGTYAHEAFALYGTCLTVGEWKEACRRASPEHASHMIGYLGPDIDAGYVKLEE